MKHIPLFFASLIFLLSCGKPYIIVVHRNVPEHPAFLIQSSNSAGHSFTLEIQKYFLSAGASVIEDIQPSEQVTEQATALDQSSVNAKVPSESLNLSGARDVGQKKTKTRTYLSKPTNADYLVLTDSERDIIKVIKLTTGEVISIFTLEPSGDKRLNKADQIKIFLDNLLERTKK